MRADHPGGAPPVGARFSGVFRRVAHGRYTLTDYGKQLLKEFPSSVLVKEYPHYYEEKRMRRLTKPKEVPVERSVPSIYPPSKADFVRKAWQDILDILKNKSTIRTLSRKNPNEIISVRPGSIVVTSLETGTDRTLSKADFFYYLEILGENGSLNPREDIRESKFFKKSAIMCAIIAELPYVTYALNPVTLYLKR